MDPRWQELIDSHRRGVIPLSNLIDYRYRHAHPKEFRARRRALRERPRLIANYRADSELQSAIKLVGSAVQPLFWRIFVFVLLTIVFAPMVLMLFAIDVARKFDPWCELKLNQVRCSRMNRHFQKFEVLERSKILSELGQSCLHSSQINA